MSLSDELKYFNDFKDYLSKVTFESISLNSDLHDFYKRFIARKLSKGNKTFLRFAEELRDSNFNGELHIKSDDEELNRNIRFRRLTEEDIEFILRVGDCMYCVTNRFEYLTYPAIEVIEIKLNK